MMLPSAVDGRMAEQLLEPLEHHPSTERVDLDEAVGDLVEVVDLLDVDAALLAEPLAQLEGLHERRELLHEIVLRRRHDRHLQAERLLGLATASGSRCVTTGLPYAIDSIAKTPCQR